MTQAVGATSVSIRRRNGQPSASIRPSSVRDTALEHPSPVSSQNGDYTVHGPDVVCIAWIDIFCLTRQCITQAVARANPSFRIFSFKTVSDFLEAQEQKLDVVVYHTHETNPLSVADIVALRRAFASIRLIVLSDAVSLDPALVKSVVLQGVSGFILIGQTSLQMLLSSLALVASGGSFVPKELFYHQENTDEPTAREPRLDPARLTEREFEVLQLVKQGKANKVIALALRLSESTVKVHIRNSMRKMGSTNRTHLAMNVDHHVEARLKYA